MGRLAVMQNSPWQQRFSLAAPAFFSPFLLGSQKESHYYFGRFIYYVMTGQGYGVFEWIVKLIFSCTHCHLAGQGELLERHFYNNNVFRWQLLLFFTIFAWQPKESHYYFGRFIYYVMTGLGYGVFEL